MWKRNINDEPVVLTLSSDEDEETKGTSPQKDYLHSLNQDSSFKLKNQNIVQEPINPKEPVITPNFNSDHYQLFHNNFPGVTLKQVNRGKSDLSVFLHCRSFRLGSYKEVPVDRVHFSFDGVQMTVPPFAEGEKAPVCLTFPLEGIVKVLAHFGAGLPVLFLYVSDPVACNIRSQLKMEDRNGYYFDPCSQEESQKRVALLPETVRSGIVNMIKNILNFEVRDLQNGQRRPFFEEISERDANEILVKSNPVEIDTLLSHSRTLISYETRTLLVFPSPPNKGGITISMDDFCCLKDQQFLNDVLVDFYLKWLHMCYLSEEDRERTHIFSTFFYKRLTSIHKKGSRPHATEDDPSLSAAEKRHSRVKAWSKNVDLFKKDFILIPINEDSHWFLAVICFPGLDGPLRMSDGKPSPKPQVTEALRYSTRNRRRSEIPIIDDGEGSDRDEAEGDDNELDDFEDDLEPPKKKLRDRESQPSIKQPCILILDSLSGSSRSRIVATLRDYLYVEHKERKGVAKEFTRETMQGTCPKVPQQTNFSDCGIFTLQYAQSFFECPLKDFNIPINGSIGLVNWFNQDVVSRKRDDIAELIKRLMDEYKPSHGINLPPIHVEGSNEEQTTAGNSASDSTSDEDKKGKVDGKEAVRAEEYNDEGDNNKRKRKKKSNAKNIKSETEGHNGNEEKAEAKVEETKNNNKEGDSETANFVVKKNSSEAHDNGERDSARSVIIFASKSDSGESQLEDYTSCSSTIKYLNNIIENQAKANKSCTKTKTASKALTNESSSLGIEEKSEKCTKQSFTSSPNAVDETEAKNVNSSLQLLCDSYDDVDSEDDLIFLPNAKKNSISVQINPIDKGKTQNLSASER